MPDDSPHSASSPAPRSEPTDGQAMVVESMLCDHAQVVEGKLFISGGGIDRMVLPAGTQPPYVANFAVAGLVRVPWTATNAEHVLRFRFVTEDGGVPELPEGAAAGPEGITGEMRFNVGRPPQATSGEEQMVPFAFSFQGLPLVRAGRYVMMLSVDDLEVGQSAFTVVVPAGQHA